MRRFDEPIMVHGESVPAKFLWRKQWWAVRQVQHRWRETGAWWRGPQVRAARGDEVAAPAGDLLCESEVFRVLATGGRTGTEGIYELSHDGSVWVLRGVID